MAKVRKTMVSASYTKSFTNFYGSASQSAMEELELADGEDAVKVRRIRRKKLKAEVVKGVHDMLKELDVPDKSGK